MKKTPDPSSPDGPGYRPASKDWRASYRTAGPYLGLGLQMAFTMVFFTGLGYLIDTWLESLPWGLIAGAALGMVAIFLQLFRMVAQMNRQTEAERARRKRTSES